jgi:hypothetical protein
LLKRFGEYSHQPVTSELNIEDMKIGQVPNPVASLLKSQGTREESEKKVLHDCI